MRGEGRRVQILPAVEHRAWQPEAAVRLTISSSGAQSLAPISVPTLLRRTVERSPDSLALRCREEGGGHLDWTYSQYYQEVMTVARAWISLGLERLHTVCVVGHPHPRHHVSNMAAIHAGAFTAGIYQTSSPAACSYIARDSRANIIVVGDTAQLEKIVSIRHELPHLRAIVLFDGQTDIDGVLSWDQILEIGTETARSQSSLLPLLQVGPHPTAVWTRGSATSPSTSAASSATPRAPRVTPRVSCCHMTIL